MHSSLDPVITARPAAASLAELRPGGGEGGGWGVGDASVTRSKV
jgi:hypothetical protein